MSIAERQTFLPLDKLLVGTSCIKSSFADDMHTPGGLRKPDSASAANFDNFHGLGSR
jgi:hypothetical protein